MVGEIVKGKTPYSAYIPTPAVLELTKIVQSDYSQGWDILNNEWPELNSYSVIERTNKDQRTFNSFVDESVEDPNEAWKWRGTRSLARNKAMAMHAHLTAEFIVPLVSAQNEGQKEDINMSEVMRDSMEWLTVNSEYRSSFLRATMGMLVNPVTYMGAEWCEVFQKVKLKEDGVYTTKEVLDEVLSGFQCPVLSPDQVLISNAYEQNIQKQRVIIERRYVEYSELKGKWQNHENWEYVRPGMKTVFNAEDNMFYDLVDDDHPNMVEECTWKNRMEDSEIVFLGGIYMGDSNIEWNPIKHRDNRNAPKYNKVPFGYERIGEHFFYYKSLMNRVGWDDRLLDAIYEVGMNRELLDAETPILFTGVEKVDSSVIFPGASMATENPNAKATPLMPPSSGGFYRAMQTIEDSMSNTSISDIQQGDLPQASQKAFSVAQAQRNAQIIQMGTMKSIGESIVQYGNLMVDIIVNHLTAPEMDEITDSVKYRTLTLSNQTVNGKNVSKRIMFDETLMNDMSKEEHDEYVYKMMSEVGYPDNKEEIYAVNPHLFSKMKYLVRIDVDTMTPKSRQYRQQVAERMYTLLRQDPLIEHEALVRELAHSFVDGRADNLITKNSPQGAAGPLQAPQQASQPAPNLAAILQ